jgi:hypothetical protein
LRSCYQSEWIFPENPGVRCKGYYYFNDDAPHFPELHPWGSRNWTEGFEPNDAPIGEQLGKQKWRNGSFPTVKPDALLDPSKPCFGGDHPRGYDWQVDGAPRGIFFAHAGDSREQGYLVPSLPYLLFLVAKGPFPSAPAAGLDAEQRYPLYRLFCIQECIGYPGLRRLTDGTTTLKCR